MQMLQERDGRTATVEAKNEARQRVINAVLDEQDRQWELHGDVVDPNALATTSSKYSAESVQEACQMGEADEEFALVYNPHPAHDEIQHDQQHDQENSSPAAGAGELQRSVSSASIHDVLAKVLSMSDLTTLGVTVTSTPQTCKADLRRRPSQQLFNTAANMTPPSYPMMMHKVPSKTSLPIPSTSGVAVTNPLLQHRNCTSLLDLQSLGVQDDMARHRRPLCGLPSSMMVLDPIFQEDYEDEDVLCF